MNETNRMQGLMIANGGLVLLAGLLAGLPFAFNLLGAIELWPIPFKLDMQIPGTERAWRAAHIGNILNASMLLAIAGVLPRLRLAVGTLKAIAWCLIVTVWGNAIFYFGACFTDGRGLTMGANKFGGGDWMNSIAFFAALIAVYAVLYAVVQVVRGGFAAAREARD
jgi:hypothetical protein